MPSINYFIKSYCLFIIATRRSGVVVRGDVRKDAEGFEDIDDFWVDGDSMQDDSVDDDDCA